MLTWLKLLLIELDSTHDIIEPDCPIEKDAKVIGQMSEMAKKLFTLAKLLEKDAYQNELDCYYSSDKTQKSELNAKANEYVAKSQVIKLLMWIGIRDELKLWGEEIGIRTGFKVVVNPSDSDNMPPFLKRLFGGE